MEEKIKMLHQELQNAKDTFETMLAAMIAGRELLIWGAVSRNDFHFAFAEKYQVTIAGYIDCNREVTEFGGCPVWHPDSVSVEHRFILVGLNHFYDDVVKVLHGWGKVSGRDYLYLLRNESTITRCNGSYSDFYGNKILGHVDGFKVHMSNQSVLFIGSGCKIDDSVEITLGNNSMLMLGDHCVVDKNVRIAINFDGVGIIGKGSRIRRECQFVCNKGALSIGEGCTFGENFKAFVGHGGKMTVHDDCMFSSDIIVQGYDAHQMYDLVLEENLNKKRSYEIEIGRHVWIGRRCNVLYGARIGDGSVIGMGSLVCKNVPSNVIAAGNPLRITRRNAAWRREPTWPFSDDKSLFEAYDFSV